MDDKVKVFVRFYGYKCEFCVLGTPFHSFSVRTYLGSGGWVPLRCKCRFYFLRTYGIWNSVRKVAKLDIHIIQ